MLLTFIELDWCSFICGNVMNVLPRLLKLYRLNVLTRLPAYPEIGLMEKSRLINHDIFANYWCRRLSVVQWA